MKRSTYYYNVKKPAALDKYAEVKASILEIYEKSNKTYGYPRISKAREKGQVIWRICRFLRMKSLAK